MRPGGERNNPLTSAEKAGMAAFAAVPELEIGGESGLQPVDDGDVLALEPGAAFIQEMEQDRRAVLAQMQLVPKEDRTPLSSDFSDNEPTRP